MNEVVVHEKKAELVAGSHVAPIVPRTVEEVFRIAQAVVKAGLAPDSYDNDPQKIVVGIMKGSEVGFPPITALSTIAIINKRPCIWGDGAIALVQASGELESIREWFTGEDGQDDWTAHCEMKRAGQDETYKGQFSVTDAKRAKLWGNPKRTPWMLYPQRMLQMRARSWAIRNGFADSLCGLSIAEEVRDLPVEPPVIDKGFLDAPQIEHHETEPTTGQMPDTPEERGEEPEASEEPTAEPPQEEDPAADYKRMVRASLARCVSVENIDAYWEGQAEPLSKQPKAVKDELENLYQVRRQELAKTEGALV